MFFKANRKDAAPVEGVRAVKQRREWLDQRGRGFRLPVPKVLFPITAERRAERAIVQARKKQFEAFKEILFPRLQELLDEFAADEGRIDSNESDGKIQKNVKNDAFSGKFSAILGQIRVEFARRLTDTELERIFERSGIEVNSHNLGQFKKLWKRVLNVDVFQSEPWLAEKQRQKVTESVNLIKSIDESLFADVEGVVTRGARGGRTIPAIQKEIGERFDVSQSRAKLIARDQVGKFNGELDRLRQTNTGLTRYRWRTSLDDRVRDAHIVREGKVYSWDDPPSDGHPGEPIQCRCYAEPVFEDLDGEGNDIETEPGGDGKPRRKKKKKATSKAKAEKPTVEQQLADKQRMNKAKLEMARDERLQAARKGNLTESLQRKVEKFEKTERQIENFKLQKAAVQNLKKTKSPELARWERALEKSRADLEKRFAKLK